MIKESFLKEVDFADRQDLVRRKSIKRKEGPGYQNNKQDYWEGQSGD